MRIYKDLMFRTDNFGNIIICEGEKHMHTVCAPDKDSDMFLLQLIHCKEIFETIGDSPVCFDYELYKSHVTVVLNKTGHLLVSVYEDGDCKFDEIFANWCYGACCIKKLTEIEENIHRDWDAMKDQISSK